MGLVREGEGIAAGVLGSVGMTDLGKAREQVAVEMQKASK